MGFHAKSVVGIEIKVIHEDWTVGSLVNQIYNLCNMVKSLWYDTCKHTYQTKKKILVGYEAYYINSNQVLDIGVFFFRIFSVLDFVYFKLFRNC